MSTIQLKVTLPRPLHALLKQQADSFGLTLSSYVKNLIIEDVKEPKAANFPEHQASEMVEKSYKKAMKSHSGDVVVTSLAELDKFLKEM